MLPRIHTPVEPAPAGHRATLTTIRQDRARALVRATGEWDLANAEQLGDLIDRHIDAGRRFVRLDLSTVTFLDCACLDVLEVAHRRLLAARGTLVLTGLPARVARVLRITGLDDVLLTTTVSDLDAHADRLAPGSRPPAARSIMQPA